MSKKKKFVELTIDDNIYSNKSIGYVEDMKIVAKGGIKGQKVEAQLGRKRSSHREGKIIKVLEKSPLETELGCPHKEECGGCSYQSLTYEKELELKTDMYLNLFEKEKIDGEKFMGIEPAPSMAEYRNKMEYTFGDEYRDGPLALGMNKKGKFFEVVEVNKCNIVDGDFTLLLERILSYSQDKDYKKYHRRSHQGFLRHLVLRKALTTGEILINLVTTSQDSLAEDFIEYVLASPGLQGEIVGIIQTENDGVADVVQADRVNMLYGRDYLRERILDLDFEISPFSFFQTNTFGAEKLYSIVRDFVGEGQNDIVFDLYSGTGTIAQILSPVCNKVVGIEIVEEAVDKARENARLNKLENVEFIAGDVLKEIDGLDYSPNLIIIDPPREGINPKAIDKILDFEPDTFVYVSCNPVSLCRDLKVFEARGYEIIKIKGMDMFPRTPHIETIVRLEYRGNN